MKAAKKTAKAAKSDSAPTKPRMEIFDCEQGTDEWFAARLGIVTASNFSKVMAEGEGKTRERYMGDLAGEIMTGVPAEGFTNAAMQRGRDMEHKIREAYIASTFDPVRRVGFVKNHGLMKYAVAGASPDALVGDKGGLEIKSMAPALLIALSKKGATLPPEHRAQVQGNIWICEREWWDFRVGYAAREGFPGIRPYEVRVYRDDAYIKQISNAVEAFSYDLKMMVERYRAPGG